MDTAFEIINNLLFFKNKEVVDDDLKLFVPYLVSRYLSMYSNETCNYANEILNNKHLIDVLEPMEVYNLYNTLIPKLRYKKINYIKKSKAEKAPSKKEQEEQIKLEAFAKNAELSIKEVTNIINTIKELNERSK